MEYEEILKKMLARIPDNIDKREGSIIYNALAPSALELATLYYELQNNINLLFIDTAVNEYLDRLCDQIGLTRKKATYAIRKGLFYNVDNETFDVEIGTRYSCNSIVFEVTERIEAGIYKLTCETAGTEGNNYAGDLIPLQYIQGLAKVEITDILIPGEDTEADEDLRERYYEAIREKPFAGNIIDYKIKTKEIDGVGAVKVIPAWNGGGKVKLVILDSEYNKASSTLIETVQEEIDPKQDGNGIGLAPIGHKVTVVTIENLLVNLSTNLTISGEISKNIVKEKITEIVEEYLLELRKNWENTETITVRISQIEAKILNIDGVIDIENTRLNGNNTNLEISTEQIPILGEVTIV